jgi:hypothetical protein
MFFSKVGRTGLIPIFFGFPALPVWGHVGFSIYSGAFFWLIDWVHIDDKESSFDILALGAN